MIVDDLMTSYTLQFVARVPFRDSVSFLLVIGSSAEH